MDDKKTHNLFTPDAESEQNFWMMAQQRAAAPGIPGYTGFYPMLRPMGGPPGINPIRHILPQIPTRASNPRTAVSKASLRDPFPGLARPDMFSGFITGDPLNREIIWRDECKAGGREVFDQVEMARTNKLDLMPPSGNEIVQDMSMATVRSSSLGKDDGDGFPPADNDYHRDVESESEFLRKAEPVFETTQLVEVDDVEKPAASSVDIKIAGNDDQKVFGEVAKDVIDGPPPSLPVSSSKLKETTTTGNPIKLKIRCDFKEGHKELMAIIGNDSGGNKHDGSSETTAAAAAAASAMTVHQAAEQTSPQGLLSLAPPSPQTVLHAAPVPSPSMSIVRPKTGRAKTNAELKKQLMEKRAVQYLKGQGDGGSQASSPATSHVDVSSPASLQADVPSPLSTQTESVSTDALDSSYERLALSRNSQNGKGKRPGTLTTGVSDSDSPSLDPTPPTETKWVVGDMLWARVSGHPWWPCIVSPDPFQQMYTKVITRGHKVTFRQYHVLFFGEEGERGWVQESTAIPFEGRTKFENFCDEMIKEQKRDKRNFTVAPNRRRAWEVAVTDAERARTMPRVRRIEEYVTVYDSVEPVVLNRKEIQKVDKESSSSTAKASEDGATQNKPSSHAKQPRKSPAEDAAAAAPNRSTESGSPPRKKQRLAAEPASESPSHIKLPKNISNQHVIQYTVFCQKRRDSVKSKHPEYDDEQVENCLQEQWSKLDDETRSRFIPMGSDFTYLSQMMATVGMPKAPTGVKRSSRFVKTKKKPTLKKSDKEKTKAPDIKEIVPDGDGKEKGISKEEKRTPRLRTSAEKKCMEVEPPTSKDPLESFSDKGAKVEKSSPVQSPLSVAASTGIPPKKRGRKSKEVRASPVEIVEQKPNEMEQAKKVITPAARKEMASKSVVGIEDEDTEEELDDVYVCFICEKSTKGIEQCQGSCQGHFHPSCLSQSSPVGGRFLCDECFADNHKCFVCKTSDPKTVPCCVSECGRYYHEQCLGAFVPEGASAVTSDRPFSCPLHSCFTCQLKKPDKGSMNEVDADVTDLLTCVRCPMAYHMTDSCVSAGSLALTGKYIVCSRHFEPSKAHSLHTKTSSSWCFVCEKGGSVLYCDSCPAAYHASCLQMSAVPSGPWQCPDCSHGKTPLYGDLVWVKFGSYRWWPAEIYHPASLPSNIQDLPHQVGEFPVCFFGSHDYLWLHRGRVFPFREGDKCCREADAKGTAKIFDKAMKEAIAVYRMLNPNAKPPTNSAGERNVEKLGSEKKKNNHDADGSRMDDNDDDDDKGDVGGGHDDVDAEPGVCSSQKASTTSGDRRTRRAKVRPNSKVLRQLQRQSRALSMLETPRSSTDGRAAKTVNDHETECYRCSRDGVLILCDKPRCPKAYHRRCINKMKLPHGIWLCPWHHCDTCGKAAIQFCSRCPNSYCADHVVNNIVFSYELGMVCSKHPDVKVDSQDMATFPLAYLDPGVPGQVPQSKATGEKKRRGKSAKEKPAPSSMDRRSAVTRHKLTDLESSAGNSKSDDGPIDKKVVLPAARKGGGSERKGSKRPRSSKSRKSSDAFKKTGNADKPTVSLAARQSNNPELGNSGALSSSAGKNPASQLDSPMFDNSDDEFPQLVIDVPTL